MIGIQKLGSSLKGSPTLLGTGDVQEDVMHNSERQNLEQSNTTTQNKFSCYSAKVVFHDGVYDLYKNNEKKNGCCKYYIFFSFTTMVPNAKFQKRTLCMKCITICSIFNLYKLHYCNVKQIDRSRKKKQRTFIPVHIIL